ncbi:MAG TPA: F0F1 ATP synthase subunit delta [Candidatus Doudnabacteria bacterium]|nr:F0F1 ATP synthase subunit delta [Candidatus Doudnabacteria bacterium]
MKYTVKQYAQSLYDVLETTNPKQQDIVIDNFINILKTNDDLAAYEKIVAEYEKLLDIKQNTSQVTITTATDANITPALLKELNKYSKDKIETTQITDEQILGGVVIRVDDTLIDASLRTELNNLESKLKD